MMDAVHNEEGQELNGYIQRIKRGLAQSALKCSKTPNIMRENDLTIKASLYVSCAAPWLLQMRQVSPASISVDHVVLTRMMVSARV
jgi:hypothetical protein